MLFRSKVLKIVTVLAAFATLPQAHSAVASSSNTIPVKSQMLKARAFFMEGENGLYEALDLKSKSLTMKAAIDLCGNQLVRKALTLNYSCTINIPNKAKVSKLQNLITAKRLEVTFGGLKKDVNIDVSADAKSITYSMAFDATGFDFEVLKFNDDFAKTNAKLAHLVIAEAMKQPVRIEVLEARQ